MKLIILDRDGVINADSDTYIKSPEEWIPLPGSLEAIARLNQAGYRVVVASNQSGIARGLFTLDTLHRIHDKLHRLLEAVGGEIEAIFFCPHAPDAGCTCRKPRPGLLLDIGERLQVSLNAIPMVGDSLRDLQAAQAVGARPLLVRTGKGEHTLAHAEGLVGIEVFADLAAVVETLLSRDAGHVPL